jgi:hypothetical protein
MILALELFGTGWVLLLYRLLASLCAVGTCAVITEPRCSFLLARDLTDGRLPESCDFNRGCLLNSSQEEETGQAWSMIKKNDGTLPALGKLPSLQSFHSREVSGAEAVDELLFDPVSSEKLLAVRLRSKD